MEEYGKKYQLFKEIPQYYKYQYLDEGISGRCYKTKDGKYIYKELMNTKLDKYSMKRFTYENSDSVAFPRIIVYKGKLDDDHIVGNLSTPIEEPSFNKLSGDVKISDIVKATDELEKELRNLAERGIKIFDLQGAHTFYTKDKKIVLTDTDLYEYSLEEPIILFKENMKELGLFYALYFNEASPYKSERLNNLFNLIFYGKIKPSRLIEYMMEEMIKETGNNIETINDFREGQQLIRKLK